jgi:hypothetical protein
VAVFRAPAAVAEDLVEEIAVTAPPWDVLRGVGQKRVWMFVIVVVIHIEKV